MLASLVQGPLLRLASVGLILVALQRTLFTDLRPAGVSVQVVLALAAAAGAGRRTAEGRPRRLHPRADVRPGAGTPLGSSSITMGLAGYAAGYVTSITIDPQWWLAGLFTALGAAVGEAAVPVVRAFIGEEDVFSPRLGVVVAVVAAGALVLSPVLVPVGRWCMRDQAPGMERARGMNEVDRAPGRDRLVPWQLTSAPPASASSPSSPRCCSAPSAPGCGSCRPCRPTRCSESVDARKTKVDPARARAGADLRRRRADPRRQHPGAHRRRRLGGDPRRHRPGRDLQPPVRLAGRCRSRTWRPATTPTATAGTSRCR